MKYNEADSEFLTKDTLTLDPEFLNDASQFLYETEGDVYSEPEEIYDAFMEHMRFSNVNEYTTARDLMFVRDASDEMKEKTARLFHTYDKMDMFREGEDFSDMINTFGDYAEGILTAPSTYLGILTGGLAKGTSIAGQQVAKAAVRKELLSQITKRGVMIGAATEGAIGVGQGDLQERIKVELYPEHEYDIQNVALQGGLSAVPGGIFGGLSARKGAKQGIRAERITQIGAEKVARKNEAATQVAMQTIQSADDTKKRQISQILVGAGDEVRKEKLPQSEYLLTQLDDSTQVRIQAAAIELGADLKPIKFTDGSTERITETIARAIADGSINARNFDEIMTKYNLTSPQLALLFTADVSRAARTLQRASQVARVRKMAEAISQQATMGYEEGDLARVLRGGFSEADIEQMGQYQKVIKAFSQGFQGFEQMRRGLMTTQFQTTQRNIAGGGMRVFIDEAENLLNAPFRRLFGETGSETQPMKVTAGSMMKYMFNQSEAKMIADVFSTALPKDASRLFAEFIDVADAQTLSGVGGGLAKFGRKMNYMNMLADNYFKKAIFAGQLDRLVQSKFNKSITELMLAGEMDKITVDMYRNASEKAFELLYQKTPSNKTALGKIANAYLRVDKLPGIGMLTGLVAPFPRFMMNQAQFVAERAPIIGLAFGKDKGFGEQAVKQLSGLSMIMGFAAFRATQGPESKWYNYTNEKGETTNLAPMLAGLTPFLYMGDLVYRGITEKAEIPQGSKIVRDLQSVMVGEAFKIGASKTLFDRTLPSIFNSLLDGKELDIRAGEEIGKILGDYMATLAYNLPTGLARDAYGLYDEEARMIIETNGEISLGDAFMMRVTRGLPAFMRDPVLEWYDPNIPIRSRPVITKEEDTKTVLPLSTTVTGLNLQAPESALELELNRLGLETYDIYKAHPFGPADVILRDRLGDRLNEEALGIMATETYQNYTDSGKRDMMRKRLRQVVSDERKIVFDELRDRVTSGQEKRFNLSKLEQFRFESTGTADNRRQAEAEFRKSYKKSEDYVIGSTEGDYAKLNDLLDAYMKELESNKRARGGLIQKFAVGGMPTPMDEQMDALSLSETAEEEQQAEEGVTVGQYFGMLNELRKGITGGAMKAEADLVKFVDDAIDYLKDQDADMDAPLTQFTQATLGKWGTDIVGDSEIANLSSKLIGENLGVIEALAPGVKLIGQAPEALGIFADAGRAKKKKKQYDDLMAEPARPGETEVDKIERIRQETGIGVIKGLDDTPRLEISDFSVPLNAVRRKDPLTDKEVFFGIDGLPLGHPNSKLTMGDVFPHADLFEYYPEARNIPIVAEPGSGGGFLLPHKGDPARISVGEDVATENALKETLIHELQHFVQWSDRLNAGGNRTAFTLQGLDNIEAVLSEAGKKLHQSDAIQDGLRNAGQRYAIGDGETAWQGFRDRILKPLRSTDPDEVERKQKEIKRWFGDKVANDLIEYAKLGNEYIKLQQEPFRRYMLLAGEVEARMTGDRLFMSPALRQRNKPDVADVLKSDERRYDIKYDDYGTDQLMQARHRPLLSDTWGYMFGDSYSKAIKGSEKTATDLIDRMLESKAIDISDDSRVMLNQARTSIQKDSMNKRSYRHINEALDAPQSPVIDATDRFAQKRVADTFKTTKVLDVDQEAEVADFYKMARRDGLDESYMNQAVGKYLMDNGHFPDVKLGETRKLYLTAPDGTRHPYIIRVDDVNISEHMAKDPVEGTQYFDIGTGVPVQRNVTVEVLDDGFDFGDEPGEEIIGQVYDMPYEYFLENTEMMGGLRAVDDAVEELAPAKKGLGRRTEKVDKDADQGRQHALETKDRFRAPEEMRQELGEGFGSSPEMREFFASNPTHGEVLQKRLELGEREYGLMRTSDTKSLDDMVSLPNDMAGQYHPYEFFDIDVPEGRKTDEAFKATHKARRKDWLKRTGKGPNKEVGKRNMRMQDAAKQVMDGELSAAEFRKIADEEMPLTLWDKLPELATNEDMVMALDPSKVRNGIVGLTDLIEQGDYITSRLDIPAYENFDTWVVTILPSKGKNFDFSDIHGINYKKSGSVYANAVHMKEVNFVPKKDYTSNKALETAAGAGKNPYAAFEGRYMNTDPEGMYNASQEFLQESLKEGSDWIQVGFDPRRRGFFYDRRTGEPVLSADEVVQIGPLVLARKAVKGDADDFAFNKGGLMSRR